MPFVYLTETDRIVAVHEDTAAVPLETYQPNGATRVVQVPSTSLTMGVDPITGLPSQRLVDGWEETVIDNG